MSKGIGHKTWACPKERARFYSKQYQDRLRAEGGEKHATWLAARRASDAKRREARRAAREADGTARIRKMAEDVRKARVAEQKRQFREKVNAQIQQAGSAQGRRAKAKPAPTVATQDEWPNTDAFIRAHPERFERLHPGACRDPLRVIGVAL